MRLSLRLVGHGAPFVALLATLLAAAPAAGQEVHGVITDAGDQSPVPTVEVFLLDEVGEVRAQAVTDSLGEFHIQAPAPGRYQLRVSRIGYATRTTAPFEVGRGEVVTLEIELSTEALQLEPLEAVERKRERAPGLAHFYDRAEHVRKSGTGRIYFREDLQQYGSVYGLYRMQPIRSSCPLTVLLDNLPVSDPRDLEFLAQSDRVEGVEVYRSRYQFPLEYASYQACSLMLVWSRPAVGTGLSIKKLLLATGAAAAFFVLIWLR